MPRSRVYAACWVETPLDLDALRPELEAARSVGINAVAIVCMHAWKTPAHEVAIADLVRGMGFGQVSVSHEVSPLVKLVGRAWPRRWGPRHQTGRGFVDAVSWSA